MLCLEKQLEKMTELSKLHHVDQKYGEHDYFEYHLMGVCNTLKFLGFDLEHQIVALGHDILEDTQCTVEELKDLFGVEITDAIICLTKNYHGDEDYRDYLKRCSKNKIASMVKFHDMSFNMLNCVKEGRVGRQNRYLAGMHQLQEFINRFQGGENV